MTTPQLTLDNLIGQGFFPKELIPAFQTNQLAKITERTVNNKNEFLKGHERSNCSYHSFPKNQVTRRNLGIPNPLHQLILSNEIYKNWESIYNLCQKSELSASRLMVDKKTKYGRSVSPDYNFQIVNERIIRSSGLRYSLYTDISRYYSTLYTHSIPWAIHGKDEAKKNRHNDGLYGNSIDKAIRNTQNQQSLGIPIGTDTSFIIGEIIGSKIDNQLCSILGKIPDGFRYIDDYYLYFETISEAETTLKILHQIFNEFELEPNSQKTYIINLPEVFENIAILDLKNFKFTERESSFRQNEKLLTFFNKVFDYHKKFPSENIIKYGLSNIKKIIIIPDNWKIFEAILLQCLIADSSVISIITDLLIRYNNARYEDKKYSIDTTKISQVLNKFIGYQSELNHSYEVAWGLYLCKSLKIKVEDAVVNKVIQVQDSIVAVITCHLCQNGLIDSQQPLERWQSFMDKENLYSKYWLLAYEADFFGWCVNPEKKNYVNSDPFFSMLKEEDISFFNPETTINYDKEYDVQNDEFLWYYSRIIDIPLKLDKLSDDK
ncbi:RNA-directed DNA polymerase [Crocosphaera sp. XPORK-15E]|nr:RNA-directed DNA polymerase [Crocosphaera sp. XPORK-15E]